MSSLLDGPVENLFRFLGELANLTTSHGTKLFSFTVLKMLQCEFADACCSSGIVCEWVEDISVHKLL
jgi:hypothetical protein